jgi:uncharacterized membrane protein YiaA
MILTTIGFLAALVAALTSLAMLQDATRTPADTSARGWCRHIMRLCLLIGITASAVVLLMSPATRQASLYEIALRCCLTGILVMQSPCPWWRYVFRGQGSFVDRRRRSA